RASTSRCAVTPTKCRSKSSSGEARCRSRSCSADSDPAGRISRRRASDRGCLMCRNIKTLHNFEPPATEEEIRASALQFVRKLSGFTQPSKANQAAFSRAVEQVTQAAHELLDALVTSAPLRAPARGRNDRHLASAATTRARRAALSTAEAARGQPACRGFLAETASALRPRKDARHARPTAVPPDAAESRGRRGRARPGGGTRPAPARS